MLKNSSVEIRTVSEMKRDLNRSLKNLATKSNWLLHLMHDLAKARNTEKFYLLVTEYSLKIFDVESVAIYIPQGHNLIAASTATVKDLAGQINRIKAIKEYSIKSPAVISQAFRNKKVFTGATENIPQLNQIGLRKLSVFPILLKDQVLGVFVLRCRFDNNLTEENARIAELLALHLGVKIHNQDLVDSLRQQTETLELLQNSVKEGLSLHGPDGTIYYANKEIAHFFGNTASTVGVKREDLVKDWSKYHKYQISRLYDTGEMEKAIYQEKRPFVNNLMVIHSNPPKIIEANYYPVIKNDEFAGMAAAYRDVTKEKKQEQELEQNLKRIQKEKERWQAVFTNVDEGVCLVDKDLKITHMNAACETYCGLSLDQALGKNYYTVFKCHTSGGLYYPDFHPLEKLLITKEPLPYEEHLHTSAHGEESWVGVSAAPIKTTDGEIQEIVLVIRDINALKEVEKAKSQFVSIASHELRTPLTVVNGYLSLLINGDLGNFEDEESRKRLQTVLSKVANETDRLTKLVSDLLNVSRIEEKRIQLNKQPASVREVVNGVLEELTYVAAQKNVQLRAEHNSEEEISAVFDKSKIYQVLLNLVDNAIKFTSNGGEVLVRYWEEDGSVKVAVKDTGIGIPRKLQGIIFEKFQQVPGSYLKENRGTGLGLYIVKSLVELHDGYLTVDSEPGKGSEFTFSLPKAVA